MVAAVITNPALLGELARFDIGFRLPEFGLHHIRWDDIVTGTLLFTLPQIPLTLGNAVVAIAAENNELFPDRPVTERTMMRFSVPVTVGKSNRIWAPVRPSQCPTM